jgi:hypothetical protein
MSTPATTKTPRKPRAKKVVATEAAAPQHEAIKETEPMAIEPMTELTMAVSELSVQPTDIPALSGDDDDDLSDGAENVVLSTNNKVPKKRGRKPKGGKIIVNNVFEPSSVLPEPNIILHLKCGQADLQQAPALSEQDGLDSFAIEKSSLSFQVLHDAASKHKYVENKATDDTVALPTSTQGHELSMKEIWGKVKELTYHLHTNNLTDKKSACFWCTCDFDNPPIFIPKYELNNTYHVYGCFCSPECATAFLFREPLDSATRFERYHLLNHIYCKIYNYTKNIKPAPDPFYTLSKYLGNLSIQEYRRLLKNERLLLIVDKPLSRTLPELHEDNDEFLTSNKTIPSASMYKYPLKRRTKQTKADIFTENFNIPALSTSASSAIMVS